MPGGGHRLRPYQGSLPTWRSGLPTGQPAADVVRVELQVFADVLERVQPAPVLCPKPGVSLAKQPSPPRGTGVAVTKPAGNCVLEDCEQETPRTTPVTSGAMSQNKE